MCAAISPEKGRRRFILIDDTATLRELLKQALLRKFAPCDVEDYEVGRAGLEAVIRNPPDLLMVDLYLHDTDGRDIVRELRRTNQSVKVIVLTAHPDPGLPAELISLGVAGFVDKNSPLEQVERAVERVLEGGMFFSAAIPPPVPELQGEPELSRVSPDVLSAREREVIRLVARGYLSKEVGSQLGLSTRTVEKHRSRIFAKLHLRDTPSLVRWCLRNGLG